VEINMAKTYLRYGSARAYAEQIGADSIIRVGPVYVVPDAGSWISMDVINVGGERDGAIDATVTLHHLRRLGNANHAIAHPKWGNDPKTKRQ
jgi:hypothetical protein